ncbi:MAG: ABC transporter substrate-binding protein, partial [Desulfobacula sp.]|nr:ABC transporter substrate-binding protein [Desulfobacula sp.]
MKHFKIAVLLLVFFVACFFYQINTALASPVQDELKITIDNILEILRDPSFKGDEKKAERRASLRSIIHKRFSFAKMSQLSLARHWKKRSDQEKKVFIKMFGQLLEDTYVSKIETYTDEKVIYVKEFIKKNKAMVYTKVVTQTIEIPIDYRLYKTKSENWMVYDLVIEGVSLVGNYRSQFDQML